MTWRASSIDNATCIEVASDGTWYLLRDSKDPDGPILRFTEPEWIAFTNGVKAGEFDCEYETDAE